MATPPVNYGTQPKAPSDKSPFSSPKKDSQGLISKGLRKVGRAAKIFFENGRAVVHTIYQPKDPHLVPTPPPDEEQLFYSSEGEGF